MLLLGQPLATYAEIFKITVQLHFNINKWLALCYSWGNLTQTFFRLLFPYPLQRCNGS